MTINTEVREESQKLVVDSLVPLWDLDTTTIGGESVYHFTDATLSGTTIQYNGITYSPIDYSFEGFEVQADGALQRPKISVSNVLWSFAAPVLSLNNMTGAKITRTLTHMKYLDGQPLANTSAHYPPEIYFIDRKSEHNKMKITFELKTILDIGGKKVPNRIILRKCGFRYREWDGDEFVNPAPEGLNCPYSGTNYYTSQGVATTAANDKCGKTVSDCRLRFGTTAVVPFYGFPGSGNLRYPFR